MRTNTTEQEIKTIIAALGKLHVRPFGCESSDPKRNAQRNLDGKTHYVDDDTLRWHKSRVLGAGAIHGGLLFQIVTSDALDMNNTKRGYRAVVFDVFGTVLSRPILEDASSTKQAALKASGHETVDLLAHYREAIENGIRQMESEINQRRQALETLNAATRQQAA